MTMADDPYLDPPVPLGPNPDPDVPAPAPAPARWMTYVGQDPTVLIGWGAVDPGATVSLPGWLAERLLTSVSWVPGSDPNAASAAEAEAAPAAADLPKAKRPAKAAE